jgi:hypothetical protein
MALLTPRETPARYSSPARSGVPFGEPQQEAGKERLSIKDQYLQELIENNPYFTIYAYLFSDQPLVRKFFVNRNYDYLVPDFFKNVLEKGRYDFGVRYEKDNQEGYIELEAQLPEMLQDVWDKISESRKQKVRQCINRDPELSRNLLLFEQLLETLLAKPVENKGPTLAKRPYILVEPEVRAKVERRYPGFLSKISPGVNEVQGKKEYRKNLANELDQEFPDIQKAQVENPAERTLYLLKQLEQNLLHSYFKVNAKSFYFSHEGESQTEEEFLTQLSRCRFNYIWGSTVITDGDQVLELCVRSQNGLNEMTISDLYDWWLNHPNEPKRMNFSQTVEANTLAINNRIYSNLLEDIRLLKQRISDMATPDFLEYVERFLESLQALYPYPFEYLELQDVRWLRHLGEEAPDLTYWALQAFGPEYYRKRAVVAARQNLPTTEQLLNKPAMVTEEKGSTENDAKVPVADIPLRLGWKAERVVNTSEQEMKERATERHFILTGQLDQIKKITSLAINDTLADSAHHFEPYHLSKTPTLACWQVNEVSLALDENGRTALPLPEFAKLEQLRVQLNGKRLTASQYTIEYDARAGQYRIQIPGALENQSIYFEAHFQVEVEKQKPLEKVISKEQLRSLIHSLEQAKLTFVANAFKLLEKEKVLNITQIWEVCRVVAKYSFQEKSVELPKNATPTEIFTALRKLTTLTRPGFNLLHLIRKEKLPIQCNGAAAFAQAVTQIVCPDWEAGIESCYLVDPREIRNPKEEGQAKISITGDKYHARLIVSPDQKTRTRLYRIDTSPSLGGLKAISLEVTRKIAQLFSKEPEDEEYIPHQDELEKEEVDVLPPGPPPENRLTIEQVHQRLVEIEWALNSGFILQVTTDEQQKGNRLQRRTDAMFVLEREILLPLIKMTQSEASFNGEIYLQVKEKLQKLKLELGKLYRARIALDNKRFELQNQGERSHFRFVDLDIENKFQEEAKIFDAFPEYGALNITYLQEKVDSIGMLLP